jgi:WD40 repeat protein
MHVAAGNDRGEVVIWQLRSGHLIASLKGHTDIVNSVAFMPNGEGLISGGRDNTLKYWDVGGSALLAQISGTKGHEMANDEGQKLSWTFAGHTVRPFLSLIQPLFGKTVYFPPFPS